MHHAAGLHRYVLARAGGGAVVDFIGALIFLGLFSAAWTMFRRWIMGADGGASDADDV